MTPSKTRAGTRRHASPALKDGDLLAAVDIGSNSFHMVVARYTLGQLRIVDRIRDMVRMAEGLDAKGHLAAPVRARALDSLSRLGQRIADIPPHRVRAIATNTVRALKDQPGFLLPAEAALGHAIEVVAGREEARLIYLGVAKAQPPRPGQQRLVIDIGGGSTESIIGKGMQPLERESVQVGCVATTRRFFRDGKLSRKAWRDGLLEVSAQFQQFASLYRALGWNEAIGTSGTIRAIGKICAGLGLTEGDITPAALAGVREALLTAGRIEAIDLPGLSADRRPVIAGGVLVLEAAFHALGVQSMQVSKAAMREGVLYDLLGRVTREDPRKASVKALERRYGIDAAQADRVERTTLHFFDHLADDWGLDAEMRPLLRWAARLHELGLAIAHSQYHLHGAYVLEHSDIAGFSQQEQAVLAALVGSHRRKVGKGLFDAVPQRLRLASQRCAALLRLAVLLHRGHGELHLPALALQAKGDRLQLRIARSKLEKRPLLAEDLRSEIDDMPGLGIVLDIKAI